MALIFFFFYIWKCKEIVFYLRNLVIKDKLNLTEDVGKKNNMGKEHLRLR